MKAVSWFLFERCWVDSMFSSISVKNCPRQFFSAVKVISKSVPVTRSLQSSLVRYLLWHVYFFQIAGGPSVAQNVAPASTVDDILSGLGNLSRSQVIGSRAIDQQSTQQNTTRRF